MENRAQKYIRAGFKVFELAAGKTPRSGSHGFKDAHSDLALAATIPDDRCGVFPNGRLLVDVDIHRKGGEWGRLDEQEVRSGAPMGVDAHGDGHYLYAMPDAPWVALVTQKAGLLGSPIDIRCSAGYFRAKEDPPETIPPCPSGLLAAVKEWAETKGPKSTGRTEWPEPTKTPDEIRGLLFQQDAGMGRDAWRSRLSWVRVLCGEDGYDLAWDWSQNGVREQAFTEPLTPEDFDLNWHSLDFADHTPEKCLAELNGGFEDDLPPPAGHNGGPPLNDPDAPEPASEKGSKKVGSALGDTLFATEFVRRHGGSYRYRKYRNTGEWRAWTGDQWSLDTDIRNTMGIVIRSLCDKDDDVKRFDTGGHINSALATAAESLIRREWDPDPYLIGHKGGTCTDLRTGETRTQRKDDWITVVTPVAPADKPSALLQSMLKAWSREGPNGPVDQDWIDYVRTAGASCLIDRNPKRRVYVHLGNTASGKTTIQEAWKAALGTDLAASLPKDVVVGEFNRHRSALAKLDKKRMAMCAEPTRDGKWNLGNLLELSGGDSIDANFMRKDSFDFICQASLFIACNEVPATAKGDPGNALHRRMRVVPFDNGVEEESEDDTLQVALQGRERAGVLRMMIDDAVAAVQIMETGLGWPEPECARIRRATDLYFASEREAEGWDEWLAECVEITGSKDDLVKSADAWQSYETFTIDRPRALNKRRFEKRMTDTRGILSGRFYFDDGRKRGYAGIRLSVSH